MLILVRHGRTAANAGGRLLGRLDPPLDEIGTAQAAALATALAGLDRPVVLTSPLTRTRQTADAIAGVVGTEPQADQRWIELDYGDLDGMPLAEVPTDVWRAWRADVDFRPPGGESLAELGARVRASLADLAEAAVERDVVVVSHVSPIKAAVAWALGVGDEITWRLFLSPASITTIALTSYGPSLTGFNEGGHLR